MDEKKQIAISTLTKILGNPKRGGDISEYEFNCKSKTCRNDQGKFNLAYNAKGNMFQCWKCKYGGTVHRIVEDYGNKDDVNRIYSIIPKQKFDKNSQKNIKYNDTFTCSLPEGFKSLLKESNSKHYKSAVRYATGKGKDQRGLSWETIKKYNIGYTEDKGNRKYRIIVPSYNPYGQMNYYVGRAYYGLVKPAYMAPAKEEIKRVEIIFNSRNINFDIPVFLVEGVFDMFPLYNSIPMLGKEPSPVIIEKLIKHNTKVVLCLDEDALSDSIKIYNELTSHGLDVYFIEVPGDIDEFHKKHGKQSTIELLKMCRDVDFQSIFQNLALKEKSNKIEIIDEVALRVEWEKMKKEILKNQDGQ